MNEYNLTYKNNRESIKQLTATHGYVSAGDLGYMRITVQNYNGEDFTYEANQIILLDSLKNDYVRGYNQQYRPDQQLHNPLAEELIQGAFKSEGDIIIDNTLNTGFKGTDLGGTHVSNDHDHLPNTIDGTYTNSGVGDSQGAITFTDFDIKDGDLVMVSISADQRWVYVHGRCSLASNLVIKEVQGER